MRTDLWSILEPVEVNPRIKSWKDVLRNLVYHANEAGEAWPNEDTIRRETGYKSRRAIISAIQALEGLGLIARTRIGGGRGTRMVFRLNVNERSVKVLTKVDNFDDKSENGEVTSTNGEVSSPLKTGNGEVTSNNGEVTSKNGEVSSHGIKKEQNKNIPSFIYIEPNGEVTSKSVDKSAPQAVTAEELLAPQQPKRTEILAKMAAGGTKAGDVDYLALCSKPGWRPNDPIQAPLFEEAKKAVMACAYRAGLNAEEVKRFWSKNAVHRWNGVDCGNCVAELARAWCENWKREDPQAWFAECARRRQAAAERRYQT